MRSHLYMFGVLQPDCGSSGASAAEGSVQGSFTLVPGVSGGGGKDQLSNTRAGQRTVEEASSAMSQALRQKIVCRSLRGVDFGLGSMGAAGQICF